MFLLYQCFKTSCMYVCNFFFLRNVKTSVFFTLSYRCPKSSHVLCIRGILNERPLYKQLYAFGSTMDRKRGIFLVPPPPLSVVVEDMAQKIHRKEERVRGKRRSTAHIPRGSQEKRRSTKVEATPPPIAPSLSLTFHTSISLWLSSSVRHPSVRHIDKKETDIISMIWLIKPYIRAKVDSHPSYLTSVNLLSKYLQTRGQIWKTFSISILIFKSFYKNKYLYIYISNYYY